MPMNFRIFFTSFLIVMSYSFCNFAMQKSDLKLAKEAKVERLFKRLIARVEKDEADLLKDKSISRRTSDNKNESNACKDHTIYTMVFGMAAVGMYYIFELCSNNPSAFLITPI